MIEDIILIAKEAGGIIRSNFGRTTTIEYKTNISNLVTEVDRKSEEAIINFIQKKYPGHNILAEESGSHSLDSEYTWIIDPLDGTTNFAHGLPIFSVSIGLQRGDETLFGVVYDVMGDNLFSAEKGRGAFLDGTRIRVNNNENLSESFLVTGFPYDIVSNPYRALEIFCSFVKASRGVRRLGSAAIDFCYVAKGVFDGFWEVYLNPWDLCAGKLILEEAGGIVTNFCNEAIGIQSKQILATNGKIHESMINIIKEFN